MKRPKQSNKTDTNQISAELITCCDLVAKFKVDTPEEKLIVKGFVEDIFNVLIKIDDLSMQLAVSERLLSGNVKSKNAGNIKLSNKFVRIILGFCVGKEVLSLILYSYIVWKT